MSLNNLVLPAQLIADLYHHVLVEDSASHVPGKPAVSFLGKNNRHILVVVDDDTVPHLSDQALQFLTTVLAACSLSLADVAIVNRAAGVNGNAAAVLAQLQPTTILLFGVDAALFGFDAPPALYTLSTQNKQSMMVAPPLEVIEADKEAKKQLWAALKKLFCL